MVNQDGTINQVFVNYAKRRGLDVTVEFNEDGNQVWVWDLENDCEPLIIYLVNSDYTLSFRGKLFPALEDLPAWIGTKRKFYSLLDYTADMLKASK